MQKIKYITNKDLLAEIKVCKATYCHFTSKDHATYHAIVDQAAITPELVAETITTMANKQSTKLAVVDPASIPPDSVVFRVMTDAHLPPTGDKNKRRETSTGEMIKTNFNPFRHFILQGEELVEVGRSHWRGDFETGKFSVVHGAINNRLAGMFMLLVEQYSRRGNWRGYTYNDEMRSHALVQLSQVGLQFDESRSDNPFAFYTQIIKNCLAFDTMILTREYGSVAIGDVAEQDVTLLDGEGNWVKSHIYDYGLQETININFSGGFDKVSIRSTLDHGWVQDGTGERIETRHFIDRNGYDTKDIRIADLRPSKEIVDADAYRRGVIHGIVYGDGSKYSSKDAFFIRLCGEKRELDAWFSHYKVSYQASSEGDPIFYLMNIIDDLKALPVSPGESLDYLLGFMRGWLATDGCVSTEACVSLCGDAAEFEWVKTWGPLVGWHTSTFSLLAEKTNFGKRNKISGNMHFKKHSMDTEDFLRSKHAQRWIDVTATVGRKPRHWRVYPAKQNRQDYARQTERVFCPDVQTTHTVALSSGIHSFQCFRRILNLEHRTQQIRDDLLIMAGAMPSYTRQVENEIDQRDEPVRSDKPARRGRKPKEPS